MRAQFSSWHQESGLSKAKTQLGKIVICKNLIQVLLETGAFMLGM